MIQEESGKIRKEKWYNSYIFPLIPLLTIKKADKYNTEGFTFKWLFITLWTLDNVQFEVAIVLDTHWGIGFIGLLPYLRWVISIPCPPNIGIWFDKLTSRKPKRNESSIL